jgi:YbbR domain-containing protein
MRRYNPFAHTGLKIVSVALAALLWVMVSSQRAFVERGIRIPLELQNLPENLEMVEPPQESVDVRVRGTADALARLVPGDLVATADLSSAQPGRRLFHLAPDRVKVPFAVEVTQVAPSSVAIRFELSATRIVPIQPSVQGEPAPGFIVGRIAADPATVEIVGPDSVLRRVTEAITEPLWVGSATTAVRSSVTVGVADQGVRLKTARSAMVTVAIVPAPAERRLQAVPVRVRNLATGLMARVTPPTVRVRARGTNAAIARIRDASLVAFVDLEGIGEGDYGLPVRLEPLEDVGVDQLDPAVVSIHVQ